MTLPFFARAVCLVLCCGGVLQPAMEAAVWACSPALLGGRGSARRQERSLFAAVLLARAAPWLLVLLFLLPAYLAAEDNHGTEPVSLLSIALACCIGGLGCTSLLRAARAVRSSRRFLRQAAATEATLCGSPVMFHADHPSLVAVAGFLSSTILVSPALLQGRFSQEALQVVFKHERAHARNRDNLKQLLLTLCPHVAFATRSRPSVERQWRLCAEMAADAESTGSQPEQALLLAEVLVSLARGSMPATPLGITALHADGATELRLRVERLLECAPSAERDRSCVPDWGPRQALGGQVSLLAAAGATLATTCALCILLGHRAAELLFHGV